MLILFNQKAWHSVVLKYKFFRINTFKEIFLHKKNDYYINDFLVYVRDLILD